MVLSAENKRQFWIPEGYAHGFLGLSDRVIFTYLCTDVWVKEVDSNIRWDDPRIGIDWPIDAPLLSDKDAAAPLLADIDEDRLPMVVA